VITDLPARINFRGHFDVGVRGDASEIASVVLLRSDHNTHSLTAGDRYIKLAFEARNGGNDNGQGNRVARAASCA
jgi:hypothetical protein